MKLNKRRIISVVIILLIIAGIGLGIYLKQVADYQQSVKDITFGELDIYDVADGTYSGECNVNFIYAKVEVTVKDGVLTNIELLEHKNDQGQAAEKIVNKIVEEQKVDVDAVSGATNSSTVIKKAVENALR